MPWDNGKVYETLGKLVRATRKHAGLTQEELGRRVGLTRTSITNLEKGRQRIQVHTLYELASALDLDPQDLLPSEESLLSEEIDVQIPEELAEEERAWVKQILRTRAE